MDSPIVIAEDDFDDQFMITEALKAIGNKRPLLFFENGQDVFDYLVKTSVPPFLIISDINMPKVNGLELRDKIWAHEELRKKSIPFVFFTTSASKESVERAYSAAVQGFFEKPHNMDDLKSILKLITEYWHISVAPDVYFN